MAESTSKRTPRDVLRVIFRRRQLFLLGASLVAFALLLGAHYLPLKYTGTTMFERRTDVAADDTLDRGSESFETLKLALRHELAGRDAVERVVLDLGLTRGLPHAADGQLTRAGEVAKQQMVQKLMSQIKLKWDVRSRSLDLVSVSITHADPKLARHIPDTLVKSYINRTYEQIIHRLTASRDFLKDQAGNCESRLTELTNRKIDFETRHASMMPESPGALQERIDQTTSDIEALRLEQNIARQTLARLKPFRKEATTQPTTQPVQVVKGPNPELARVREQLRDFRDQLDSAIMLRHMTDKHPTVMTLREKVAQLEKQIEEMPEEAVLHTVYGTAGISPQLSAQIAAAAEARLETTTRQIDRLEKRLDRMQTLMANFAPIRQDYMQIMDKVTREEAELAVRRKRLNEVDMALAAEAAKRRTHLNAVQVAEEQLLPSSPKLTMVLAVALIGGLAIGGGLVFLTNTLDRSVTTTEDAIRHFGLPVHGVIGEIIGRRQRSRGRMKRWGVWPVVVTTILLCLSLSASSVVLWLRYPEKYREWKVSPVRFVYRAAADLATGGTETP